MFKSKHCHCTPEELAEYKSLSKTTNRYPCIIGDQYFIEKEDLDEFLDEYKLNPDELIIYGCEQRPLPPLKEEYWEEHMTEDGELPGNLESLIDEFNTKLALIPGLWWEDSTTRFVYNPSKHIG